MTKKWSLQYMETNILSQELSIYVSAHRIFRFFRERLNTGKYPFRRPHILKFGNFSTFLKLMKEIEKADNGSRIYLVVRSNGFHSFNSKSFVSFMLLLWLLYSIILSRNKYFLISLAILECGVIGRNQRTDASYPLFLEIWFYLKRLVRLWDGLTVLSVW